MAGSANITGKQNYVLGIGHPKTEAPTEGAPAVFSEDGKSLVGVDGVVYPIAKPRVGVLRAATFGDSTATFGSHGGVANASDQEFLSVGATSAVTTITGSSNKFLADVAYPGLFLVAQGGIGGETTGQMLSRDGQAFSATRNSINDVLAKKPDVVFFRGASINDIFALSLAGNATDAQLNTIAARHFNIFRKLQAGGAFVIDEGCAGYDATGGVPPSNQAFIRNAVARINAIFEAWHLSNNTFSWLSPVGITCNADGSFIVGSTGAGDGTHLSYVGQYKLALAEAEMLKQRFGAAPSACWQGTNLLDTLSYLNVGGSLPTGMAWASGNATVSGQAIEIDPLTGVACAAADLTGVTSGGYFTFALPLNVYTGAPTPNIAVTSGMKLGLEVDWSIETKDGSLLGPDIVTYSRVNFQNASGGRSMIDFGSSTVVGDQGNFGASRINLHSAHATQINDVTANLTSSCQWRLQAYLTEGVTYRVRIKSPRIVQIP